MMSSSEHNYETKQYDVIVIGAGGAGLRAAIEASAQGASVALVTNPYLVRHTPLWLKVVWLQH